MFWYQLTGWWRGNNNNNNSTERTSRQCWKKNNNNERMKESKQMKLIRSSTFHFNTLRSVFHFHFVIVISFSAERVYVSVCVRHATTLRPENCEKRFLLMYKGKLLIEETYCTKIRLQQQNPYRNSTSAQPKRSCVCVCLRLSVSTANKRW